MSNASFGNLFALMGLLFLSFLMVPTLKKYLGLEKEKESVLDLKIRGE